MQQKKSSVIQYHQRSYEIVKYVVSETAFWYIYNYVNGVRGDYLFGFTDVGYTVRQAEHTTSHILLNYDSGVLAGRKQIKKELQDLVDTQLD